MKASGLLTFLRTVSALSRPAGLPTVWSNCVAGWWLGGGGDVEKLPFLIVGATFLYLGGAFLNDVFDADRDQQHEPKRPIPAGAVALRTVWRWGAAWLVLGTLTLLWSGEAAGGLAVALAACCILYNAIHRLVVISPLLLGLCRFFLYLIAASTGEKGVTGSSLWCGLALTAYVTGMAALARQQPPPGRPPRWAALLVATPVCLALIMNVNGYREPALLLSAIVGFWGLRCLRSAFWSPERDVGRAASGLLAGIVWVDWLAVAYAPRQLGFVFISLFLAAVLVRWVTDKKAP